MLRLEHIRKIYPTGEVLKDINWEVKTGERVGLVGVNGAGKSTQMKIIMGEVEPTDGEIIRPADLRIAHLTQEFDVVPTRTVREELWTVFTEANAVQDEIHRIQHEMAEPDADLDDLIHQLDRAQRKFEALDGYRLESQIEKILPEVGFEIEDGDRLVSSFSGGWQMRISLGKILLQEPDILLLDEPTNHLDLETIEWLENYLRGLKTPMVIISHDREFLDRLCTKIVETERGISTTYLGNYSQYLQQKAENKDAQQSAFERQQKDLAKQQEFIEKFRASAPAAPRQRVAKNYWIRSNASKRPLVMCGPSSSSFPQRPGAARRW